MHKISMIGSGLIGMFYSLTIHGNRSRDQVQVLYSRSEERARESAEAWGIPEWTTSIEEAVNHPDTDVVIVAVPNSMHKDVVLMAAAAGKAVLCTKPLATNAADAKEMLDAVERAGVFHGYLEDLTYTPKALKTIDAVSKGAVGDVLWTRSRETHPGPHSAWFWDEEISGGGAIVDMGCHCIAMSRALVGRDIRPVEVMCWADTQVHPIEVEDSAIGLIRYETGAIGQFEVSWAFRGGMDLRDEVSGTEGTVWVNHWLRTGFEMFTNVGQEGYVAEKAEGEKGWLFPVGDELAELGYVGMFSRMFDHLDAGTAPMETFYDGYVVNAIMDACYRSVESHAWEPVVIEDWRGREGVEKVSGHKEYDADHLLIKEELMPDGSTKLILKEKQSGKILERTV